MCIVDTIPNVEYPYVIQIRQVLGRQGANYTLGQLAPLGASDGG